MQLYNFIVHWHGRLVSNFNQPLDRKNIIKTLTIGDSMLNINDIVHYALSARCYLGKKLENERKKKTIISGLRL